MRILASPGTESVVGVLLQQRSQARSRATADNLLLAWVGSDRLESLYDEVRVCMG